MPIKLVLKKKEGKHKKPTASCLLHTYWPCLICRYIIFWYSRRRWEDGVDTEFYVISVPSVPKWVNNKKQKQIISKYEHYSFSPRKSSSLYTCENEMPIEKTRFPRHITFIILSTELLILSQLLYNVSITFLRNRKIQRNDSLSRSLIVDILTNYWHNSCGVIVTQQPSILGIFSPTEGFDQWFWRAFVYCLGRIRR